MDSIQPGQMPLSSPRSVSLELFTWSERFSWASHSKFGSSCSCIHCDCVGSVCSDPKSVEKEEKSTHVAHFCVCIVECENIDLWMLFCINCHLKKTWVTMRRNGFKNRIFCVVQNTSCWGQKIETLQKPNDKNRARSTKVQSNQKTKRCLQTSSREILSQKSWCKNADKAVMVKTSSSDLVLKKRSV